jgi:hypothetical protein
MAFKNFRRNVTTSGTQVRLVTTSTPATDVLIRAKYTNTGKVYLGDSTTNKTTHSPIEAGYCIGLTWTANMPIDLAEIWVDADVSSEGVEVWYNSL